MQVRSDFSVFLLSLSAAHRLFLVLPPNLPPKRLSKQEPNKVGTDKESIFSSSIYILKQGRAKANNLSKSNVCEHGNFSYTLSLLIMPTTKGGNLLKHTVF